MSSQTTENKDLKAYKDYISKIFGKKAELIVEDPENIVLERFSSGSLILDKNLKGGFVKGTMIEIFGDAGSGKTSLCIHAVAEHQKKYPDEMVLWVDLEKVFDPEYFQNIGINISTDKFILARPNTGEEAWEMMIQFTKIFQNGLIVLDSVTLLLPSKEDDSSVGDAQMGSAARMNSQGLRKLFPYIGFGKTTLLCINQVRSKIGGYGLNEATTGGRGWEFYARTRIRSTVSKGEDGEFSIHKYRQIKSNYGHKDSVSEVVIEYGEGFNKEKELLDLCVENGIITKGGSWFSYGETKLGQGAVNVADLLRDNIELYEELYSKLKEKNIL